MPLGVGLLTRVKDGDSDTLDEELIAEADTDGVIVLEAVSDSVSELDAI